VNLEFRNIGHHYGDTRALANINLQISAGEVVCLLGPSGCGKSTLLSLAAGLIDVQRGEIALDGTILASAAVNPPPEERPVGLVFQDGALFPHMSVADNILFGLPKAERSPELAAEWLHRIGLEGIGARFPASLSGGQQQRVALARAMAPNPEVLLLDEPFASIDVVLRRGLRRECRRLLKERHATAIMVTHDPQEAIDVGDRIAVMENGEIIQFGSPSDLYHDPASAQIGALFDDSTILEARIKSDGVETAFGTWHKEALASSAKVDGPVDLLIREHALSLEPDPAGLHIQDVKERGANNLITLRNEAGQSITLTMESGAPLPANTRFALQPKPGSILAFAKPA